MDRSYIVGDDSMTAMIRWTYYRVFSVFNIQYSPRAESIVQRSTFSRQTKKRRGQIERVDTFLLLAHSNVQNNFHTFSAKIIPIIRHVRGPDSAITFSHKAGYLQRNSCSRLMVSSAHLSETRLLLGPTPCRSHIAAAR